MVAAVRRNQSQRAVARRFGVSLGHLQHWLARAHGRKLSAVQWADPREQPLLKTFQYEFPNKRFHPT